MSASPLAPLFGSFYGSLYLGTIISTAVYGATCMQTFFYYVHYENDALPIKIFVAIIWALNTIHEALCISGVYKYIAAGLVNPFSFMTAVPDLVLTHLLSALVAVPTQGFLVYRIYIFSGKNIAAPLIWAVLALVQLVSATVFVGKALYNVNGVVHAITIDAINSGIIETSNTVSLSVAAGLDILIAIFMTFLLLRKRTTTGFANTVHLLQRLTVFAVSTGTWTATFALLAITLLHVFPTKLFYVLFFFPLCPVYFNTLLANLNARAYFRNEGMHNVDIELLTSPSSRVSDNIRGDKHPELGEALPRMDISSSPKVDSVAIEPPVAAKFPDVKHSNTVWVEIL